MKHRRSSFLIGTLAIATLQFAVMNSQAQIIATNGNTVIINNFDTSDQVYLNDNLGGGGVYSWGNWFGAAYSNVVWDASDASNNASSGSMLIQSYFPDGGVGGGSGPQFVVYAGNDPFSPPFNGFGNTTPNVTIVTNFSCDVRFAPFDGTNADGTFPTIEFGTRGVDYGQHDFGTLSVPGTNTNWVHVSIPLAQNPVWTNIPNVFVKIYNNTLGSATTNVPEFLYVDNLEFHLGIPQIAPPTLAIQKTTQALRIFAEGGQYSRTYLATVDTGQSWVGGSYPVSYSFTVSATDPNSLINECHAYWLPLNTAATPLNEYSDYGSPDAVNLYIHDGGNGYLAADVAWKTNSPNANPNHLLVSVTNATMVGTWTVTFTSATDGTLTAPGVGTVAFTNTIPASVATMFANPVVWMFGMQPDTTATIGQYIDVTHAQTAAIASPGVPVNSDFTTGSIDTNIWLTSSVSAANGYGLVPVNAANTPWWVSWSTPDIGFGLATKADLGNTNVAWKTPSYYAGYPTNGPTVTATYDFGGASKWALIPAAALPTVDGTTNGAKAATSFFSLQNPSPAQ